MKNLFIFLGCVGLFSSCNPDNHPLVGEVFVDSLILHYAIPAIARKNREEMKFWKSRIKSSSSGYLNESRFAGCLALEFRFFGDINRLIEADSTLQKVDRDFNFREASVNLALASSSVTGHQFVKADSFLQRAKQLGLRPYESYSSSFDVDFELGRYRAAEQDLKAISSPDDFGYFFRKSKMNHLDGRMDSAIYAMLKAADLAGENIYLKAVAFSNAADLYVHAGKLQEAASLYTTCLQSNAADFHSLMGLGWIALVHDRNDSLAKKIFQFVLSECQLPDPIFKLMQLAEWAGDREMEQLYALAFVKRASDPRYGRMYNKYLIQVYTGILDNTALAESIAKSELANRATPQTFAWYAWTLLQNDKKDEAVKIYRQYVSGKQLEGLELYWMGRLMEDLHEGYNAMEYYKAARLNKYDLDPLMEKDIEKKLNQ